MITAHQLARALQRMPPDYIILVNADDHALVVADPILTADPMNGYVYLEPRHQVPADGEPPPARLTLWQRIRLACGF